MFSIPRPNARPILAALLALIVLFVGLAPQARASTPAATAITLGTYYGGTSDDTVLGMTTDASGIYLTGKTYSRNLPGARGTLSGSNDMFVAKLNPAGTALLWSVYLGGSKHEEGRAIVSDGQGSIYITGSTTSSDFPVTPGADEATFGGFTDIVALRLDAATGEVRWATYLGEDNLDEGNAIALDGQGHVYVAGWWAQNDAVVVKYDGNTGAGIWGRAWSNRSEAKATALAVDPAGNLWVTGTTDSIGTSSDFDIVGPALQTRCGAGSLSGDCGADAFVSRLDATTGDLLYSSLLGGSNDGSETASGKDEGSAIAVDQQGYVYVAGKTMATDFPTSNALQASKAGADNFYDGFLTKIAPDGSAIVYSTYLGGEKWDETRALVLDATGAATVLGFTGSQDFPLRNPMQPQLGDGVCELGGFERWCYDAFVLQVAPDGGLVMSSYLGGDLDDIGYALARDGSNGILLAGSTESRVEQGFPAMSGAFQPQKSPGSDGFVLRLGEAASPPPPPPTPPAEQQYRVHLPFIVRPL